MKRSAILLTIFTAGCHALPPIAEPAPRSYLLAAVACEPGHDAEPNDRITGIVDSIQCPSFPADVPAFQVVVRVAFVRGGEKHVASAELVDATTGALVTPAVGTFVTRPALSPGGLTSQVVWFTISSTRVGAPTLWHVVVTLDGERVAVVPVEVVKVAGTVAGGV